PPRGGGSLICHLLIKATAFDLIAFDLTAFGLTAFNLIVPVPDNLIICNPVHNIPLLAHSANSLHN
ncbi:hypothetical protein, partial [Pseudomonas avellanae]|uniref:hypothetical protein n=1 Tax=Pseudomonas avellanae TaxID=46257 RepID=UPI001ED9B7FF